MKSELLARLLVVALALGAGFAALAYRYWGLSGVVEVHAAMPDKGGWQPQNIEARAGEPLHLRLVSDGVVHGFAIGQFDFEPVDVLPGKPADVTLTFEEPGTYTFYCTRWCGPDHWRMRGTISVQGDEPVTNEPPNPPLYLQLGIDLDAPRQVQTLHLETNPSIKNGGTIAAQFPATQFARYLTTDFYRSQSPNQVWKALRAAPDTAHLSDSQIWDLVAWLWSQNTTPAKLAQGQALYQRDCAACHGASGAGDGIFAPETPDSSAAGKNSEGYDGSTLEAPVNFQELESMLVASPALLQGKIIRGGMGTGMPSWGLVYTEEQTWALIDYLWTFVFQSYEEQ